MTTDEQSAFLKALTGSRPNPYKALDRLLSKPQAYQRQRLRLAVWCEQGRCAPIRVFDVHDGRLVQCRSDADVSDIPNHYPRDQKWSRRRAFFASEWINLPDESQRLQVVCECAQTTTRWIDVRRLLDRVPARGTLNITLGELVAT